MRTSIGLSLAAATLVLLIVSPASKKKSGAAAALGLLVLLLMIGTRAIKGTEIISDAELRTMFASLGPFCVVFLGYGVLTALFSSMVRWMIDNDLFLFRRMPATWFNRQLVWQEYWPEDWKKPRTPDGPRST